MDRPQLADFLRTRREALAPEDVGLPRGPRRRTPGLRREEVATLVGMSSDYYGRLEQQRGPQPSEQMTAALARGLHLSHDERDHLYRLVGHAVPERGVVSEHVSPGLMRVLEGLDGVPAQVMSELGEALAQTPLARALLGNRSDRNGFERSTVYAWFTDPASRDVYPADDQLEHGRSFVAELRAVYAKRGPSSRAGRLVDELLATSEEFAAIWADHEVRAKHPRTKRLQHPEVGVMSLQCQVLVDPEDGQQLLVFTATPGSPDAEKLRLLEVVGTQSLVG
ncbi:helix-turn-helix transcriptional regulator [Angustibacter peucedani]